MDRIIKRTQLKPGCEVLFGGRLYPVRRVEHPKNGEMIIHLHEFGPVTLNSDTLVAIRVPKRPRSPRAIPPPLSVSLPADDREWLTTMTSNGTIMRPADLMAYALHRYREEVEHEQAPRRRRWPWRRLRAA